MLPDSTHPPTIAPPVAFVTNGNAASIAIVGANHCTNMSDIASSSDTTSSGNESNNANATEYTIDRLRTQLRGLRLQRRFNGHMADTS
ncbi:hypothetical protein RhiJN_06776 [Ceratobasidium sp. AG-Ba]|nr:hypothetical protein RhiJN_06776 [Ceratobasidium sp. AG-Ba]QRW07692.1 hypothetical protein RhiLY_06691 [Ceratobasidium sp. AG-Ba]QRW08918.1 hypothetical protein RhiLY_07917 [Ceratobasidium sp. AG-Ba]